MSADSKNGEYAGEGYSTIDAVLSRDYDSFTMLDWTILDYYLEKEVMETDKDAVLSAKKRNSLRSSTFCGPNRSFPIPDCAHVTAARRLIGRYKGSESTKAKIMACVNRKAKQLGCGK
jgi:hypothetical protein